VFSGPVADGRPERLEDDDGVIIELRQDMAAATRQAFSLGCIRFDV